MSVTSSALRTILLTAAALAVGAGSAQALDIKVPARPAPQARFEPVAPAVEVPVAVAKAEQGQAAAEKIVQIPACARKVKVIYAGYGESDRAACETTASR